jgi:hypothetical protein
MRDWIEAEERYYTGTEVPAQLSEMTGAVVDEVLDGSPELVLRQSDADAVRAMAYHLAIGLDVPPEQVLGIERPFETMVGGEKVTATVDLLYEVDAETLGIVDYKSGFGVPALDEFEHGFYGFQLRLYSWIATLEMGGYSRVEARCLFPRYLDSDGRVRERRLVLDKQRLQEFGRDMARLVRKTQGFFEVLTRNVYEARLGTEETLAAKRVEHGQKWPAVAGDHCTYCPCEPECPIPAHLRRWAGQIQEPEHAAEALEWSDRMSDRVRATREEARRFVEKYGPVGAGDYVYELVVSESQGLRKKSGRSDWEGMAEAVAAGTFVREEWVKPQVATRLVRTKRAVRDAREDDDG